MRIAFKSLRELKQQLPQVLDRIKTCHQRAMLATAMLDSQLSRRVNWLVSDRDMACFETDGSIMETYRNKLLYEMEEKWLQSQVDKLREHQQL